MKDNKRTDIHCPSKFDPSMYEYDCTVFQGPIPTPPVSFSLDRGAWDAYRIAVERQRAELERIRKIATGVNWASKGSCDHCGAHFHYGAVFHHINGEIIVVGHQCASENFGQDSRRDYDLKKAKARAKAARERAKAAEAADAFLNLHPGLAEALQADHHISRDMSAKLLKWGSLTEKQVAFAMKLPEIVEENKRREAEIEERKAKEEAEKKEVVEGRRELKGVIICTKWKESFYGGALKMLFKTDDGQKVWGTVPAALVDADIELKGARVSFNATVEQAKDDPFFGFFKRPAAAKILGE